MAEYDQHHVSQAELQTAYIERLTQANWPFEQQKWPLVAWRSLNTANQLQEWAEQNTPIEMSVVVIPPDGKIQDLPLKTLGYIESTLTVAESLKERQKTNITHLRLLCPVHLNVAVNGGDLATKEAHAHTIQKLVSIYAQTFHPSLGISVHLDTGNHIGEDLLTELKSALNELRDHPSVAKELSLSGRRHSHYADQDDQEVEKRSLLYLAGHGPAWGHATAEPLFSHNGFYRPEGRIVYAPMTELRFFTLALESGLINPQDAMQIVTLISGKQITAPYYSYFPNEPTIADLLDVQKLEILRQKMRVKQGDPRGADVVSNLNLLITAEQQVRKLRRGENVTLHSMLKALFA